MVSQKQILALDIATATGWAHSNGNSGVIRLRGDVGTKAAALAEWLERTTATLGSDTLAIEHSAFGARFAATREFHGILRGAVELTAKRMRLPVVRVNIATAKKIATGNGRAKKDQVMRAFRSFVGREPADDNEADAWAVLVAAQHGAVMQKKPRQRKPKPLSPGVSPRKQPNMLF